MSPVVDTDDLLGASAVAELLGLSSRTAVSVYRHRYDDFPEPVVEQPPCVLWRRQDVQLWAASRRRLEE